MHLRWCIKYSVTSCSLRQPIETPCLILLDSAQISLAFWAASLCCCILILSLLWPSTCSNVQIRCEPCGHHTRCVTDTCYLAHGTQQLAASGQFHLWGMEGAPGGLA